MINNPKNIKIPEHWLDDTEVTTYWPHKEGIWANEVTKPVLRLIAVYNNLMEIPEAKNQLWQCNDKFADEIAPSLVRLFQPVMQQARIGEKPSTPQSSEVEIGRIDAIYKPWVDNWALGSHKMLEWVGGLFIFQIIFDKLSLSRKDLRQLRRRLTKIGGQVNPPWVWKTLLNSDYKRLDQARRELAKREIQNQGYHRKHERELLIHARYWIIIRILRYGETEFLQKFMPDKNVTNFSTDILTKFDSALLEPVNKPRLGRPVGSKTILKAKAAIEEVADVVKDIVEFQQDQL